MGNNTSLLINGSGDFALLVGATAAPAQDTAYDDPKVNFGSVKSVKIDNKAESKEHWGVYRGTVTRDDQYYTKHKLKYSVVVEEFNKNVLKALYWGTQGADSSDTPPMGVFTPLANPQGLRGVARLRIWDKSDQTKPRLVHQDFLCVVTVSGSPEFKGDDWASVDLEVEVLSSLVGTVKDAKALSAS